MIFLRTTAMKESLKKFLEVLILDCYDCNMATQRHCNKRCNLCYQPSNFGTLCKGTGRWDFDALTDTLTTHRELWTTVILHGRKNESVAIEKFEALRGVKTEKFIRLEHTQLVTSPDRSVYKQW